MAAIDVNTFLIVDSRMRQQDVATATRDLLTKPAQQTSAA